MLGSDWSSRSWWLDLSVWAVNESLGKTDRRAYRNHPPRSSTRWFVGVGSLDLLGANSRRFAAASRGFAANQHVVHVLLGQRRLRAPCTCNDVQRPCNAVSGQSRSPSGWIRTVGSAATLLSRRSRHADRTRSRSRSRSSHGRRRNVDRRDGGRSSRGSGSRGSGSRRVRGYGGRHTGTRRRWRHCRSRRTSGGVSRGRGVGRVRAPRALATGRRRGWNLAASLGGRGSTGT